MNIDWLYGLVELSFFGYAAIALITTQTTLLAVTLYLHRDATHRSIDLHPVLRHFFRFWIWMTSSMLTREWVAVHRKHHAFADQPGDPHSPVNVGLRTILLEGTEYYRRAARDPELQREYGAGTPDDWIERYVYSAHRNAGIVGFVVLELVLFGIPGIILIGLQMLSMPVLAAGFINGFGHSIGYRNYEVANAATNILPWGLIAGGEELHNNHHAFPASAKFSQLRWEFDLGWACIVVLTWLRLAKVKRLAPPIGVFEQLRRSGATDSGSADAVATFMRHRMHLLRAYARQVLAPIARAELRKTMLARRADSQLLVRRPTLLDADARRRLQSILASHPTLNTLYECQDQLRQLCESIEPIREKWLEALRGWCARAEASGIQTLSDFAVALRRMAVQVNRPALAVG